jgi:hypothetical protein
VIGVILEDDSGAQALLFLLKLQNGISKLNNHIAHNGRGVRVPPVGCEQISPKYIDLSALEPLEFKPV